MEFYSRPAAQLASQNPVVPHDELWQEEDTGKIKRGFGTTHWNDLAYWSPGVGSVGIGSEISVITTVYDTPGAKTHWTSRPATLLGAHIWAVGGGGGGASGRRGAAGTVRAGGGGGAPGAIAEGFFPAADLPSGAFTFTIPAAAAGGAAVTANDTNGNVGAAAGTLTVGPLSCVHSNTAAQGGTTSGGAGGTGIVNMHGVAGSAGGAGGVGTATPAGVTATYTGSGGGGGAGITAAEAVAAGGAGGSVVQRTGYTRSTPAAGTGGPTTGGAASNGGAGNAPTTSTERTGGTGGGGGGSHATLAGGAGAAGARGAGGGGGAGSTNGADSGAGGTGGVACVIITEYRIVS